MKQLLSYFLLLMISVSFSCSRSNHQQFKQWMESNGKIKVLSTTAMIEDLVKQVGGEHVDSLTLIQGDLDPHSYQLVKGDDEKLARADVIFFNGLGLEHGPSLQRYLSQHSQAFAVGNFVEQKDPTLILHVNGQIDPHIWMDVGLWTETVPYIVKILSEKDPEHAEAFVRNGQALQNKMREVNQEMIKIFQQTPEKERYLVTSHDAFNYFARAYLSEPEERKNDQWHKRFAAPEGLAPESQLSTTDIKGIIEHMKKYQIHILFPESNVSRDSINKILQAGKEYGMDLKIACCPLYGDAMGAPGSEGETYLKMMHYNAQMIADYMNHKRN